MRLFYDDRDAVGDGRRGDRRLVWLADLGGRPLSAAAPGETGFLFAGARSADDYRRLVSRHPRIRDRPAEREPLLRLDGVLDAVAAAAIDVPTPRTWRLPLDAPLPADLTFPLFVRTAATSWKRGGRAGRVGTRSELADEAAELRRAFGWDALVLARQWVDLEAAGRSVYGPVPVEVRTWIVDGRPHAWSFHYGHVVAKPSGLPPSADDVDTLRRLAARVGSAFGSRLVVADFARTVGRQWVFIEAGPGSCAGTAHEAVFKSVAVALRGESLPVADDPVGGLFAAAAAGSH